MEGPLRRFQQDLPKLLGSCKGHWQGFIRISTTFAHKDLYKALVMIFIYHGTLRRHHTTFARSSYRTFQRTQKIFLRLFTVISGKQLNQHRPTTRAIRHAREGYGSDIKINESDPTREGYGGHVRFSPKLRAPWNMSIENIKHDAIYLCFGHFWSRSTAPATKMNPRHPMPHGIDHHVPNQKWRQFNNTQLSTLWKIL